MCGIYGVVSLSGAPLGYPAAFERMAASLGHRGPDAMGAMRVPHAVLGANRLRIVDLQARADQPFTDRRHCVSLALNGEIYNAGELRQRFARYEFQSDSDAETVLPLYVDRGAGAFADLDGMFALAIWDDASRRLVLARDRAGEKPLFYSETGDTVCFASEVQALLEHPGVSRELDPQALDDFLTHGYVLEPRTMVAGIRKVEAGTALVFDAGGRRAVRYWDLPSAGPGQEPHATLEDRLAALLEAAVRKQMAADVPLGVFLSGGLDSSLIASIATRHCPDAPLHTFTAGFPDVSFDERRVAGELAAALGSRHVEVLATGTELRRAFELTTSRIAEPIADPAILPTFLLAEKAREHVGVVLGGEGADELFGGYPTYLGHRLAGSIGRWPSAFGHRLTRLLRPSHGAVPLSFLLERFFAHATKPWMERQVAWMGTGLPSEIRGSGLPTGDWEVRNPDPRNPDPATLDVVDQAMRFDYRTYLRDGLLPKIDRATMLVSLEARSPYLDRDLTAFAFGLPGGLRVRGLTTKWLLRRAARRWLPAEQIARRKHGFSVPIASLINGALRAEVDRLLDLKRLRQQGLFNADAVGQLLKQHRGGNVRLARGIWALVIFQRWFEQWT